MAELDVLSEFVKNQAAFHGEMVVKYEGNEKRQKRHMETVSLFDDLAAYLASQAVAAPSEAKPARLALSWDEVEDLPPDLLAELSVGDGDKTEFQIMGVLERVGGVASLDRIIVELWKATGEIAKRPAVTNRLYRMGGKGMVHTIPGRKGVYASRELSALELAELK